MIDRLRDLLQVNWADAVFLINKLRSQFNETTGIRKDLIFQYISNFLQRLVKIFHTANSTVIIDTDINRTAISIKKCHNLFGETIVEFLFQLYFFSFGKNYFTLLCSTP